MGWQSIPFNTPYCIHIYYLCISYLSFICQLLLYCFSVSSSSYLHLPQSRDWDVLLSILGREKKKMARALMSSSCFFICFTFSFFPYTICQLHSLTRYLDISLIFTLGPSIRLLMAIKEDTVSIAECSPLLFLIIWVGVRLALGCRQS